MDNKRDERENSLNRKKIRFSQKCDKKKHYHIVKPAVPEKQNDDTALNTALETLVGGHYDRERRKTGINNDEPVQVYDTAPDPEKLKQMQKARFIQQKQAQEEHITSPADTRPDVYNSASIEGSNLTEQNTDYSSSEEYPTNSNSCYGYDESYTEPITDVHTEEKTTKQDVSEKEYHRTAAEKSIVEGTNGSTIPTETVERLRKAQFIKEQLERSTAVSAMTVYAGDDMAETHSSNENGQGEYSISERVDEKSSHEESLSQIHKSDEDSGVNNSSSSKAPALSDEQKADIQRSIKQKQYESKLEERRRSSEQDISAEISVQGSLSDEDFHPENDKISGPQQAGVFDEVGTAVGYVQSVQTADTQKIVVKPITDTIKRHLSDTSQTVVDGATTITSSVQGADSTQAVPFNIGMVLAENEAKKLAYKMAKGEDILAEKEQAHVQERMEESKYRFVEPDKHKPKVEKRETIREEQKRKSVKDSEIKKQAARKEAEQKAKENIFIKANRREDGLIGKIFGDEKKYHPKGKAAVIAGAATAVIPMILIIIVVMFICALFSWASPHKENIFDESTGTYKEEELSGDEVIKGYIKVIKDIYDEKQIDIIVMIAAMGCDHDMLENRWIKLDENFDIETIIAIEAAKKWRELQDSMGNDEESEEPGKDDEEIIYHLTREDFEEVVSLTYNFDARAETKTCDLCEPEVYTIYDFDTDEEYSYTVPCVHKFLMGAGVNNLVSIAGHDGGEYYFFDQIFDKSTETYEEDKMMYDLYRKVLQEQFLGTTEKPSHTIVDYSDGTEDHQRMIKVASAKGCSVDGDNITRPEE